MDNILEFIKSPFGIMIGGAAFAYIIKFLNARKVLSAKVFEVLGRFDYQRDIAYFIDLIADPEVRDKAIADEIKVLCRQLKIDIDDKVAFQILAAIKRGYSKIIELARDGKL